MTTETDAMRAAFEPCPFCGSEHIEAFQSLAACLECGAIANAARWNERAALASQRQVPVLDVASDNMPPAVTLSFNGVVLWHWMFKDAENIRAAMLVAAPAADQEAK